MIQIRWRASPRIVERKHRATVVVEIGVETRQIAGCVRLAGQSIHAVVVFLWAAAKPGVIRAAWRVRQCPEVIVERVVFLHHNDDVLDLVQVTIAKRLSWYERREHEGRQQSHSWNREQSHNPCSLLSLFGLAPNPCFRTVGSLLPITCRTNRHGESQALMESYIFPAI